MGNSQKSDHPSTWGFWLIVGVMVVLVLAAALAFLPLWPCPSCVDLDIAIFGSCDICGGTRQKDGMKRMGLLKRWRTINKLVEEGCRRVPLFP